MPTNKNALIRYKYLDRLLSDHHHYYDIHDLTNKVNDMLYEDGFPEVTQRCIEKDLNTLEYAPFSAPIERFTKYGKRCISYGKRSFSIFTKELSDEEANLLREVLSTIGQFDGLDNFKWLEDFKIGLGLEERRQIICFSNNPYLKNSNLLGTLFDYISNEVVIKLSYHTFQNPTIRSIDFHPYLLKQYNERWFLLGAADSTKYILNFALDRIDKVEPLPERKYEACPENLMGLFDNIVGVTYFADRPIEHILFWVSDVSKDYVITKPLHKTQNMYDGEEEDNLRVRFPQLIGGSFFSIECIHNYELISKFLSFGKELLVLSKGEVQDEIENDINEALKRYNQWLNTSER